MKYTFENKNWVNELYGHALLYGIARSKKLSDVSRDTDWVEKRELDIEFKINGEDVDLKDFFTRMEKYMEENVEKKAKQIVAEKFHEKFMDVEDTMTQFEKMMLDKLGVSREDLD